MAQRYDFTTWDFILYFISGMVVLIYKTVAQFQAQQWLQQLNRPAWALDLVPFSGCWAIMFFLLIVATYRAYHFYERDFGLVSIPIKARLPLSVAINVGYIMTLFHILVWAQNFFVNRSPSTALQNGIIFVASMFWLLFVYIAVDLLAALLMLIVCFWGIYVLAYNWYIINNNKIINFL